MRVDLDQAAASDRNAIDPARLSADDLNEWKANDEVQICDHGIGDRGCSFELVRISANLPPLVRAQLRRKQPDRNQPLLNR